MITMPLPKRKQDSGLLQRLRWKQEDWAERTAPLAAKRDIAGRIKYLRLLKREQLYWGRLYRTFITKVDKAHGMDKTTYANAARECEKQFDELRELIEGKEGVKKGLTKALSKDLRKPKKTE